MSEHLLSSIGCSGGSESLPPSVTFWKERWVKNAEQEAKNMVDQETRNVLRDKETGFVSRGVV